MNRKAIFCLVLSGALLLSAAYAALPFTDVSDTHEYRTAIEFAFDKGFVNGVSPTLFMPDASLTRAQLATVWARSLQFQTDNHGFKDVTRLNNYYDTPIIVLRSRGIIDGVSQNSFAPNSVITREQLALITMRTYNLGVANEDDYKRYSDYAAISEWARDGVSSCLNADVFIGLYDGESFMPQKPVTRAEICKLIYNISLPMYTITIAPLDGGEITSSATRARPGTNINLTITPDTGKQLKQGTLKYNGNEITGTSFIMPAADVTITAEFEDKEETQEAVLESIEITEEPTNKSYTVGEQLSLEGLVVTAKYSDGESKTVTDYITEPEEGSALDTAGSITVTVSYTENEITKSAAFEIEVTEQEQNGE